MRGRKPVHGHASTYAQTRTYSSWVCMRRRCLREKHHQFYNYGARLIGICERWFQSFQAFLDDMGERPPGTTLDRIDCHGNYEPGNCRWATSGQQARNSKRNRVIEFRGEKKLLCEWAELLGMSSSCLWNRLFRRHWPKHKAFTQPVQRRQKKVGV